MKHVRPHFIFNMLGENDRSVRISLPFQYSVTSMLERGILLSLVKVVRPGRIFEFGTYLGEMTRMFAENTAAQVFTLDLGEKHISDHLDSFEKKNLNKSIKHKKLFSHIPEYRQIVELFGNSKTFDFRPYYESIDFILIDGGHHIDIVRSDTENALKMITGKSSSCIVWHDYNNPEYEITEYLDSLSMELPLMHVEETKYVFYLNN